MYLPSLGTLVLDDQQKNNKRTPMRIYILNTLHLDGKIKRYNIVTVPSSEIFLP